MTKKIQHASGAILTVLRELSLACDILCRISFTHLRTFMRSTTASICELLLRRLTLKPSFLPHPVPGLFPMRSLVEQQNFAKSGTDLRKVNFVSFLSARLQNSNIFLSQILFLICPKACTTFRFNSKDFQVGLSIFPLEGCRAMHSSSPLSAFPLFTTFTRSFNNDKQQN